ncbi:hypothetical protein ACX0HA_06535 [Flavobacterium hauense]
MRLIFILFLFTINSYAQSTDKPVYVLDEKGEKISQDLFLQQSKTGKYTWITYETKDSLNTRLIKRETYGKINLKLKEQLLEVLKTITGVIVDKDQTIVINFSFKDEYPNQKRHCLDYYTSIKPYRNFFKGQTEFAQFYISQQGFKYKKEFVFEDKDDCVRKVFFPYGLGCSYIIIKPDGKFYKQMGEHRQDVIPAIAKADW